MTTTVVKKNTDEKKISQKKIDKVKKNKKNNKNNKNENKKKLIKNEISKTSADPPQPKKLENLHSTTTNENKSSPTKKFEKPKGKGKQLNKPYNKKSSFNQNQKKISASTNHQQQNQNKKSFNDGTTTTTAVNGTTEKPNWKKFKEEKKNLKIQRQSKNQKDLFTLKIEAKKLYEKLKCRATEKRPELAEQLFKMLTRDDTLIQRFVLSHDTSRIIQCLLKHSSPKVREDLSTRLIKSSVVEIITSRYAHFCILRILKYGNKNIKHKLVDSLFGSIFKLSSNAISSKIIDYIYFNIATKQQKIQMRQEFYGDFYVKSKDLSVKKLSDSFEKSPNLKKAILDSVKQKLLHVANKKLTDNSLIHSILFEYIEEIKNTGASVEEDDVIKTFALLTPTLVTTRDGVMSSSWCFWLSPTKDRRAIVKSLKEHLLKISTHEHGHTFLISIINTMDDTKSIKKNLFDPLAPNLSDMLENPYGRKVIEWFITPEDTKCFHPKLVEFFNSGLQYSKKDKELRQKEILEQIEEPLAAVIVENPKQWISNGQNGFVLATIFKKLNGENAEKAYQAIAAEICSNDWQIPSKKDNNDEMNELEPGISNSGMHYALMRILKNDEDRIKNDLENFASTLVKVIEHETLKSWINYNRGCFILLKLFEVAKEETRSQLVTKMKKVEKLLKNQSTVGSKLLIEKLNL